MNKYNIEDQLANKLGNRSITPSDNAWERIAFNRQQQAGKNKQKKKRGFFMVAAALLMFFVCGYVVNTMLGTSDVLPQVPQVVQEEVKIVPVTKSVDVVSQPVVKQNQVAVQYNDNDGVKQPTKFLEKKHYNKQSEQRNVAATELATLVYPVSVQTDETDIKATTPIIAEARSQEDVLLEKAMKDLAERKQFKATTNEAALLKEVETEMDEYYREKALRFFSLKYKKIRIVVKDNH